ncbi:hypothetical protein A8C32_05235 [Flavivirga aquatica]|uniref:Uncharacterized protein n=1 Tax=Flavivirga aquatica TaxID=1849968 RepID=A0A1E5SHL6_9FLAO|nr:hypothetical protein [Flavivirga aquatica]OEJ98604.1 hypothetical protein A8C32_05235 [Flavivirga aquatica]
MIISPAIQDYGCKIHRSWHLAPIKEDTYKPPVYATEEKEKLPFRINIDAKNSDIRNGIFGFDKIPSNYRSICKSDIEKLRQEYKPIADILDEEYLPPWLSIRKGQTVELELDWKKKSRANQYSQIAFNTHADFTITPTNLKNANKIQITCNNTNPQPAQLLIKADGTTVGALNIFYPKPKTIDLEWFFVEITGGRVDYRKLDDEIKLSRITSLLKKGLNPALIDVNIKNAVASTVNLESKKEYFKTSGIIKKAENHHYIESNKKELFVAAFNKAYKVNTTILSLFLVNRSCLTTGATGEDGGAFNVVAGFSPTGTGIAYGILDNENNLLPTAIMHEIMHALGLQHTFSTKAPHTFLAKRTKNYMDYKGSKEFTWKWQWNKLHAYPFLK